MGKAAAAVAAKLAAKVVRSTTFRWRVARIVKAAVSFHFPRYAYRTWLNSLRIEDLAQPVETGGPVLAHSLDRALSRVSSWQSDTARHSKAIELVEATYTAMVRLAAEPDADVLRDQWARVRHADLLQACLDSGWAAPLLSRQDVSSSMRLASEARRQVRLASFALDADTLADVFALLNKQRPLVPLGQIRILVGPFGSGKSELAEQWFREGVERFTQDAQAPQPLWLHASELAFQSLESALASQVPDGDLSQSGVAFVVDGLDEVEGPVAYRIASQARVYVAVNKQSSSLLTCRPGVLPRGEEEIAADGLEREDALLLVERVAGSLRSTWTWNPLLVDAIRRPFFAIAAGVLIAEESRPTGQADLIGKLVERALVLQTSASIAVTSSEIYRVLMKLGVSATRSGNQDDGLKFHERQQARTSTLVTERAGGRLEFSLPIFQQWFAARGVLEDPQLADAGVDSPEAFDRWRWALAIAGLAAVPAELDDLLERCFRADPGAGAWVLARVAEGHNGFRTEEAAAIDGPSAPERLLRATRVLVDSIGPLAPFIYPVTPGQQFITLGVKVTGNRVSTGWLLEESDGDRVIALPEGVHPLSNSDDAWIPDRSGSVAEGDEWPWILSKHRIGSSLLRLLNSHPRLGPIGGIWHAESRYRAARALMGNDSIHFSPIDAQAVLSSAHTLLAGIENPARTRFKFSRHEVGGDEILDLVTWIEHTGVNTLCRPLPTPDFPTEKADGGWVWDLYSDERLMQFYAEAYGNACAAYDEAAATVFSSFGWSMSRGAQGKFAVIADLSFADTGFGGSRTPGICGALVPLERLTEAASSSDEVAYLSSNGRAAITLSPEGSSAESWVEQCVRSLHERDADRSRAVNPFARGWGHWRSIADHTNHSRPASAIAAGWIFDDFKALKLADGTFPQLDR